jgi:hypothetical protein
MADEERRGILSEVSRNPDFSEDEGRYILSNLETHVQGAVNIRLHRQEERRRQISLLQDASLAYRFPAVLPDVDNPLVTSDPTPWSDRFFPMESAEFWAHMYGGD